MAVDDLWYSSKRERGPDGKLLPPRPTRRHGRGKRWRVRYMDDAGRPRAQSFDRRTDADLFDANVRADVSRGQYVDPAAGKVTVAAYAAQWRSTQLHRDSTAARVEQAYRLHIIPILGHLPIASVRPSAIQAWVTDRSGVLAPSTLHVVYGHLSSMFAAAAVDRAIGITPCQPSVRLPEIGRPVRSIPTPGQVHAIAAALPERYRALVYLGAGCGPRQGEAFGLELRHIDFLRREVYIAQQLVTVTGRPPYLGPVKTETSKRTIELGQVVAEALARHIERYPPVEVEIEDETDPRRPVTRMARLLFVNGGGRAIRRGGVWPRLWGRATEAAGLPDGTGYHALRHYFATLLIHAGASVVTVQRALGHATPTTTLDTYAGEWPEAVDRTRALVDAALGSAMPTLAVAR